MTINITPDISLGCLDQAAAIAARSSSKHYPQEELVWLASTAFNHAIDLYCVQDYTGCKQWGDRAMNLAKAVIDDPGFFKTMQGHWLKLNMNQ